ncbi:hypothetical protein GCM10020000_37950 [Streptomyces olivoverticillatus]
MNGERVIASCEELSWFKSSYSSGDGDDCVEVAFAWRKSSYSGDEGGECVEVATTPTPSTSGTRSSSSEGRDST